ncbi:MAG TPA: VOC family protein [Bacteroidia bacterium]|nr:VOC family protein [Bacteroidia bacterium]
MKVNHVNLTVTDAQAARHFFEKYFGLNSMEGTTDTATHVGLQDENGFVLTLMQGKPDSEIKYPPTFHIGFLHQGEERTHKLYEQLKNDGFDVKPPGFYRGNEFYFYTPFGFTVQVS